MALMEVNFFSKALMRPVTMNVILPADKVFFGEETEEENKPFKTLYLLHGVMGNYTDWVTGTCIKRWAEEKNLAVVMPSEQICSIWIIRMQMKTTVNLSEKNLQRSHEECFRYPTKKKIHLSPGYLWEDTVQSEMV